MGAPGSCNSIDAPSVPQTDGYKHRGFVVISVRTLRPSLEYFAIGLIAKPFDSLDINLQLNDPQRKVQAGGFMSASSAHPWRSPARIARCRLFLDFNQNGI
jgi:hypothetical protein